MNVKNVEEHPCNKEQIYRISLKSVDVSLYFICNSLRNLSHLQLPKVRTIIYGTENIQYRGCLLWSSLPKFLKDCSTIEEFKRKIKQWNGNSCTCRMCRVFIKDLGFLD